MELEVLENRLRICSIKKDKIQDLMHVLVKFGCLSPPRCLFFSLTITCCDYTLVIDDKAYKEFPHGCEDILNFSEDLWVPLCVGSGPYTSTKPPGGLTNIAKSMVIPLAEGGISIYSLSSYQTDYVLVKETDLHKAISCLSTWSALESGASAIPLDKVLELDKSNIISDDIRPITHEFTTASNKFIITSIDPSNLSSIAMTLLQIFFYPETHSLEEIKQPGHEVFFSYSILNGDITLVLDQDVFHKFPPNTIYEENASWRMIKIGDIPEGLGFSECGIVAQISGPIADANISEYYISTYYSDHTLVPEECLEDVINMLRSKQKVSKDTAPQPKM